MKQVRFTSVVEQSGKPEVYLLLIDPKKDPDFQTALKEHRVMTIQHMGSGAKTNYGTPGYSPGPQAQVLIFPRGLTIPPDAQVVGIKFDLLDQEHEPPEKEPAKPAKPERVEKPALKIEEKPKHVSKPAPQPEPRPEPRVLPSPEQTKSVPQPEPKSSPKTRKKVIPFSEEKPSPAQETGDIAEIKGGIRRALKALEAGKQVAAFNILKGILE